MHARASALSTVRIAALLAVMCPALALAVPELIASPTAGANNLTMDGAGSSSTRIVKLADLSLFTDDTQGFTLSVSSGSLTKANGSPIPFQVFLVNHDAGAPAASAFDVSSGDILLHSTTSAGAENLDLYIKYRAATLQDPGAYSASIDLSLMDN